MHLCAPVIHVYTVKYTPLHTPYTPYLHSSKHHYTTGLLIKVCQFQELLDVRHSVFLLGPTGCAKSTIWKTLSSCHAIRAFEAGEKKRVAVFETCNPKSVTGNELYGYVDESCVTQHHIKPDIHPFIHLHYHVYTYLTHL